MACLDSSIRCKRFRSSSCADRRQNKKLYVIVIAVVTAALAFSLVPGVWSGNGQPTSYTLPWITGVGNITRGVSIDSLSVLFACLVAFFGLIIAIYSWGYMHGEEGLTRYYFLILLFIGSMIGLVISDNMLQMFIFWEMVGLCSYALISFWYKRPESINAGIKVFIMTRIGDICLLAAIGILFMTFGTFSFQRSNQRHPDSAASGNPEHGTNGHSCVLGFRRRNLKVRSTPVVHLAI